MNRSLVRAAAWLALLLCAGLAACAYKGPAGNFFSQRGTWISYLSGEDVRQRCLAGDSNRYRLVWNANRNRHSRSWDIWDVREGAQMDQMVDRGIVFDVVGGPDDPAALGMPNRARAVLSREDFDEFERLLEASGVFDPPPVGLRLASVGFHWVISGCRNGQFFLTAIQFPSDRYDRIQFVPFLEKWDRTGVAFPPMPTPERALGNANRCPRGRGSQANNSRCFVIEVGDNGLVGVRTLN